MRLGSQHVREGSGNVLAAVDRVTQLVEHRAHPVLVGDDVGEDAYVSLTIDVGAKGVGALAWFFVKVAAGDDVVDRQTDPGIEVAAELEDVGLGVHRVEIGGEQGRGFLKEGVVIMPRPQVADWHATLLGELDVHLGLKLAERLAREVVELVEELENLVLRLLGEVKLKLVIVAKAELAARRDCAAPQRP